MSQRANLKKFFLVTDGLLLVMGRWYPVGVGDERSYALEGKGECRSSYAGFGI